MFLTACPPGSHANKHTDAIYTWSITGGVLLFMINLLEGQLIWVKGLYQVMNCRVIQETSIIPITFISSHPVTKQCSIEGQSNLRTLFSVYNYTVQQYNRYLTFTCLMESTWGNDMEIEKNKCISLVFLLHFGRLKPLRNFASGWSETHVRWTTLLSQAVTSKQDQQWKKLLYIISKFISKFPYYYLL